MIQLNFRSLLRACALLGTLGLAAPRPAHAQPKPAAKAKAPTYSKAVKEAEKALGKPLSATQKTAVQKAATTRATAMKPIQLKYRQTVAKALGMSEAQYSAKLKTATAKPKAKK